jgi:hypothetical protein
MLAQCKVENGSKTLCRLTAKAYAKAAKHWGKKRSFPYQASELEADMPSTTDVDVTLPIIPIIHDPIWPPFFDDEVPDNALLPRPDDIAPSPNAPWPPSSADSVRDHALPLHPEPALRSPNSHYIPPSPSSKHQSITSKPDDKHLSLPVNPQPWLTLHTLGSEHWLLNTITTQPSLLQDMTNEEARSLESLVNAEMEEEERYEWFAAELEVIGTVQGQEVGVMGTAQEQETEPSITKRDVDVSLKRRWRIRSICFSPFPRLCPG